MSSCLWQWNDPVYKYRHFSVSTWWGQLWFACTIVAFIVCQILTFFVFILSISHISFFFDWFCFNLPETFRLLLLELGICSVFDSHQLRIQLTYCDYLIIWLYWFICLSIFVSVPLVRRLHKFDVLALFVFAYLYVVCFCSCSLVKIFDYALFLFRMIPFGRLIFLGVLYIATSHYQSLHLPSDVVAYLYLSLVFRVSILRSTTTTRNACRHSSFPLSLSTCIL